MYKLKEIVKLFLNVIYRLYEVPLKIFGIIDFPIPPNSNMRRTSANTIKRYIYSSDDLFTYFSCCPKFWSRLQQRL